MALPIGGSGPYAFCAIDVTGIPSFVIAVVVLMAIPGPDMAYAVASGMAFGKRGACLAAAGIGGGGIILTFATALILFVAHGVAPSSVMLIQLGGAAYLFYLGITVMLPRQQVGRANPKEVVPGRQIFIRGVVTNISNPKAVIFFLSFIPQFIPPHSESPALRCVVLGVLLCGIGSIANYAFGICASFVKLPNRPILLRRTIDQYILSILFLSISAVFIMHLLDGLMK